MADDAHHEIVIIRRGGHGDHDDHHGGAWKVAFADFMTALMAFFLVMWLISANDKTKAVIAKYFNPVRLVDATVQPKGLHDQKAGERGALKPSGSKKAEEVKDATEAKAEPASKETATEKTERLDEEMRSNPLAALAEIASTKGRGAVEKPASRQAAPVIGRRGGDAFRDPFAPPPPSAGTLTEDDPDLAPAEKPVDVAALAATSPAVPAEDGPAKAATSGAQTAVKAGDAKMDAAKVDAAKKAEAARQEGEAKAMLTALKSAAKDAGGPQIDVQRTSEGLVVSLTDTETFTMFANGSAVPDKRVLAMMETVADVLAKRKGSVIIRGFTDSKQYKTHRYDNWHLSLDRAQAAHYMLIRGGFDDTRIERIEGRADRGGKPGVDPASPLNRRIEILVRDVAS